MRRPWRLPFSLRVALLSSGVFLLALLVHLFALRWTYQGTLAEHLARAGLPYDRQPIFMADVRQRVLLALLPGGLLVLAAFWLSTRKLLESVSSAVTQWTQRVNAGERDVDLPEVPAPELAAADRALGRLARALHDRQSALLRSEAQRREMFAELSHDMALPATSIMSIADSLGPLVEETPAAHELVQLLEREAERLHRLVDDVRALAMLEAPDSELSIEPIDLADVAREAAARCSLQGAAISLETSGSLLIDANGWRLERALDNLLSNAARFASRIQLSLRGDEHGVSLHVDDDGPGLSQEQLRSVTHRPGKDPRQQGATHMGLGLIIARRAAEAHGGHLELAHSTLGGLRATLWVPRRAPAAPPP